MAAIIFDTLAYTQRLEKSGFTREQAEAVANANAEALRDMTATQELGTRKDLAEAKTNLEKSLAETKADLQKQIAEAKHELLKWLIGMITTQTALLVGIIAYMR